MSLSLSLSILTHDMTRALCSYSDGVISFLDDGKEESLRNVGLLAALHALSPT
jgi:hypothetical protein